GLGTLTSFEHMFDNREMLHSSALSSDFLESLGSAGTNAGLALGPAAGLVAGLPAGFGDQEALLAVPEALAGLFPEGGIRRGSTITVNGSSSLVLALLAEVSRKQGWCAEVGSPLFGSAAAAEFG